MPAILRIDVDPAYENRILHYMGVNQGLFMGLHCWKFTTFFKEINND